jgi:hypothetical protein
MTAPDGGAARLPALHLLTGQLDVLAVGSGQARAATPAASLTCRRRSH